MISEQFHPEFCASENSSELIFMQGDVPPHWAKAVRDWLNSNLQQRWIGRGGVEDNNIPRPARSPDLAPWIFFFGGSSKARFMSKNIDSLKAAITAAFQEIPREMINSTLYSFEKRLKMVIECQGRYVEKKNP